MIQSLKKTLARLMAKKSGGTWVTFLEAAVPAVNETPKPEVLHGEAPSTVLKPPEATFMLLQDNARKFQHNQKLLETRKDKLEAEGAYRIPKPDSVKKFK